MKRSAPRDSSQELLAASKRRFLENSSLSSHKRYCVLRRPRHGAGEVGRSSSSADAAACHSTSTRVATALQPQRFTIPPSAGGLQGSSARTLFATVLGPHSTSVPET